MKISIIIPIYDTKIEDLTKCINSIRSQTFKNWECILVDDGSTNDIYYDFFKNINDDRFKFYRKKNEGLAITRNYGYKRSTGELIWFVDSDDFIINNDSFNNIINIFTNTEIDILNISYVEIFNKESKLVQKSNNEYHTYTSPICVSCIKGWRTVWRNIYRKKFLEDYKILHQNKKVLYEDVYWDLVTKNFASKLGVLEAEYYAYNRINENSITKKNKNPKLIKKIFTENIKETFHFLKNTNNISINFFIHVMYFYSYLPFIDDKNFIDELWKKRRKIKKYISFTKYIFIYLCHFRVIKFLYKLSFPFLVFLYRLFKK